MATHPLEAMHPVLADWFTQTFGEPTDVQAQAWSSIMAGRHTLIAAPTGSGKTLAALLPCIHAALPIRAFGVKVLYITPLKALNNDIHHHAVDFVRQIETLAAETGADFPGFRCAVRTGDTPSSQRASMAKRPPDLLVTTPESLFILLTSEQGRRMLSGVHQVIVDEIHALASDKRGSHLSLSLERLERVAARPIQRIGVSATQRPIERVARFLGGWSQGMGVVADPAAAAGGTVCNSFEPAAVAGATKHTLGYLPRPVHIIESRMRKTMSVSLAMPDLSQPVQSRESVWQPLLKMLFAKMEGCHSVLLFVNSRRICERLCLRINDFAGFEMARAHHGSMSKEKRLEVERMLKNGELRCLVATSSLELGIDVGHIDLVVQIDSPLDAASGIQRIGRAGHAVGDVSRGLIVLRHRGALPEAAVLGRMIGAREIDPIEIPKRPLDVLSQHTVSIVAAEEDEGLSVQELHRLVVGSDSYRELPLALLDRMLRVLSGYYPFARPLLNWHPDSGMLTKRAGSAMAAYTGSGTIPQSSEYPVHHVDTRVHLGELDEEFVHESRVGDVFLLGTNSWMIRKIDNDRIYVSEQPNRFSEVPFWRNEGPGRSYALGERIGAFMSELAERLGLDMTPDRERRRHWSESGTGSLSQLEEGKVAAAGEWLKLEYSMEHSAAEELMALCASQHAVSELPTDKRIVIEHYKDAANQTHVIMLTPFGRRVHRTWLLAIQRQFESRLPYQLYGNAKDNGIEFVLPEWDASWLQTIWQVTPASLDALLSEAVTGSPLLAISFRRIAETSLLLSRSFTRTPLWQKRLRSEELLRESLPFAAEFPYLEEAVRECLHDYLDIVHLRQLLEATQAGDIRIVVRETEFPSPMATQFLADYVSMRIYEGDGLDATTQLALLHASKELAGELFGAEAVKQAVSPEVLATEQKRLEEGERALRGPDDLAALLKRRGDLGADELIKRCGSEAIRWLEQLEAAGRAASVDLRGEEDGSPLLRWISRDEAELYAAFPRDRSAVSFITGRYVEQRISFTEPELCERYPALKLLDARRIVEEMLESGRIQQAPFAAQGDRIWSSSKLAMRMLRLTIHEARSKVKPLEPERWCGYVALRQHALHGGRLSGDEGLLAVIAKLQGLFLPVAHWEMLIFPARLTDYRKEQLDRLCASGEIIWIGQGSPGGKDGKIAFFLRSSGALYAPYLRVAKGDDSSNGHNHNGDNGEASAHPRLLELLRDGGASFLTGLSRSYGKTPSDTMADLMELVWEGHASNDQFAPLRLHGVRKGADWTKSGSGFGRWYWTGSLAEAEDGSGDEARAQAAMPWIHQLLDSYGIVTKELAGAVTPYSWDELLPVLGKLEEWGTLTRGLFIDGAMTMQFTTPEIARSLPDMKLEEGAKEHLTVLAAVDPANPFGLFIDWPSLAGRSYGRKPGCYVVMDGETWIYWIENNGRKIYRMDGSAYSGAAAGTEGGAEVGGVTGARVEASNSAGSPDSQQLKSVLGVILRRQGLTKIVVEYWNGVPVAESEASDALRRLGAERDRQSYVLWMSSLV